MQQICQNGRTLTRHSVCMGAARSSPPPFAPAPISVPRVAVTDKRQFGVAREDTHSLHQSLNAPCRLIPHHIVFEDEHSAATVVSNVPEKAVVAFCTSDCPRGPPRPSTAHPVRDPERHGSPSTHHRSVKRLPHDTVDPSPKSSTSNDLIPHPLKPLPVPRQANDMDAVKDGIQIRVVPVGGASH